MEPFDWTCPFCGHDTTITDERFDQDTHVMHIDNSDGHRNAVTTFIVCPNQNCRKITFGISLHETAYISGSGWRMGRRLHHWRLIPPSAAKVFPDYVPQAIREDYEEACRIKDASPKAAATLARRALQGMIRDFWGVRRKSLALEITALKGKVTAEVWAAVDAVRSIGNIGAHMEKDVNLIVEIEPDEVDMLIGLIEMLIKEWYVARHERGEHLKDVVALKAAKEQARKQPAAAPMPAVEDGTTAIIEEIPATTSTPDD